MHHAVVKKMNRGFPLKVCFVIIFPFSASISLKSGAVTPFCKALALYVCCSNMAVANAVDTIIT